MYNQNPDPLIQIPIYLHSPVATLTFFFLLDSSKAGELGRSLDNLPRTLSFSSLFWLQTKLKILKIAKPIVFYHLIGSTQRLICKIRDYTYVRVRRTFHGCPHGETLKRSGDLGGCKRRSGFKGHGCCYLPLLPLHICYTDLKQG